MLLEWALLLGLMSCDTPSPVSSPGPIALPRAPAPQNKSASGAPPLAQPSPKH